jgi:hypothetical protein
MNSNRVAYSQAVLTLAESTAASLKTLMDGGELAWTDDPLLPRRDRVLEARLEPFFYHIKTSLLRLGVSPER